MLESLMNSPIAWGVLSIITIVSAAYAVICQHKNKEKREFSYIKKSNSLIHKKKSKFKKLAISYDGCKVDSLCVSNFTIWNTGNKTLNKNDMVESKELTITTILRNTILDVEIVACSEETNQFSVNVIDDHTVKIDFDYVDEKDGVVVQVIHTGNEDSIKIDCKIKGGKPIKNFAKEKLSKNIDKRINKDAFNKGMIIFIVIMILILFVMAFVSTMSIFNDSLRGVLFTIEPTNMPQTIYSYSKNSSILMSIICWAYVTMMSVLYAPIAKKRFKIGIPKSLKKYC